LFCRTPEREVELAPDERAALFALGARMASARDDLLAASLRTQLDELQERYTALASPRDHRDGGQQVGVRSA
jgi:hypothetical protein